jgi:hypothetical protein
MREAAQEALTILRYDVNEQMSIRNTTNSRAEPKKEQKPWCCLLEIMTTLGASLIK